MPHYVEPLFRPPSEARSLIFQIIFLNLAGSYPKDRERLIAAADAALRQAERIPGFLDEVPSYGEEYS